MLQRVLWDDFATVVFGILKLVKRYSAIINQGCYLRCHAIQRIYHVLDCAAGLIESFLSPEFGGVRV